MVISSLAYNHDYSLSQLVNQLLVWLYYYEYGHYGWVISMIWIITNIYIFIYGL